MSGPTTSADSLALSSGLEQSAAFQQAMAAVNTIRETEAARKGEEFRVKMALSDISVALMRMEHSWSALNEVSAAASSPARDLRQAHIDPQTELFDSPFCKPDQAASSSSETLMALTRRFETLADEMSSVLASAAKQPFSSVPLPVVSILQRGFGHTSESVPQDSPGLIVTPAAAPVDTPQGAKVRGPSVVTLIDSAALQSNPASACFSPRSSSRRMSFSISDSVSFLPEEAFQPNADNLVHRGVMTTIIVSATATTQTALTSGELAARHVYIQELEARLSPDSVAAARAAAAAHSPSC